MSSADSDAAGRKPLNTPSGSASLPSIDSGFFDDVQISLDVHLGRAVMTIGELCALKAGSIVPLDIRLDECATVHFKDAVIARGEIVAVDDSFGLRITEIAPVKAP